ncbi:MAG: hydantoinase/oxoprolinase N-terminal domain-containing protein, partial [Hyphomicrobiaceae bacterium]
MTTFGLGIDIGGTFTDVVLFNGETNLQFNHKQLTTPADPTVGVIDGIAHLLRGTGIEPSSITRVVHAT